MVSVVEREPAGWAEAQFGAVELGDRRRARRAVRLATRMVRHPSASLPAQTGAWRDAKAGYRLFAREEVTFEALQAPHRRQALAAAGMRPVVLQIQGTSELDYTSHEALYDLGPIGNGGGRGFLLHSSLAVDPEGTGQILGLTDQQLLLRQPAPKGETRTQRKQRRRESQLWAESVSRVGRSPADSRWVHVTDRGGDDFSFFTACAAWGAGFLTRIYADRRMAAGHTASAPEGHLLTWARTLPALGQQTVELRGRPKRKARTAELNVSFAAVTVFPPWLERKQMEPVRCWLVRAWESNPPAGEEALEWVLLTSESVETAEFAREVTRWYSFRWLVEEYHKCLKTGCAVEQRQLQTRTRLEACIGMLAIVAVQLLQLKFVARQAPQSAALKAGPVSHVRVLAVYLNRRAEDWSVYEFWREVAKPGGFLARKNDREPGWQTLWRGWQKLDLMTLGANLAQSEPNKCG